MWLPFFYCLNCLSLMPPKRNLKAETKGVNVDGKSDTRSDTE